MNNQEKLPWHQYNNQITDAIHDDISRQWYIRSRFIAPKYKHRHPLAILPEDDLSTMEMDNKFRRSKQFSK